MAYAQHYKRLLPQLGGPKNGISLPVLIKIAAAHAVHADYRTGRNCRPSVDRVAEISGYAERTVQRARLVLRLIGVATEVVRGRQRTLDERLASHRVGDRGRGWASVYALHNPQVVDKHAGNTSAAPHPKGRPLGRSPLVSNNSLTPTSTAGELKGRATRDQADTRARIRARTPDLKGMVLASKWRQNAQTPRWAHRYTPAAWSHVLAKPAAHGWTDRDLNQLLRDHTLTGNGNWIATSPHRPVLLLAGIINKHDDLHNRPAALDDAREEEARQQRIAIRACVHCDEHGWALPYSDFASRCLHTAS
ncbi:Helix-turn-helix protein [Williamsia muralis]